MACGCMNGVVLKRSRARGDIDDKLYVCSLLANRALVVASSSLPFDRRRKEALNEKKIGWMAYRYLLVCVQHVLCNVERFMTFFSLAERLYRT